MAWSTNQFNDFAGVDRYSNTPSVPQTRNRTTLSSNKGSGQANLMIRQTSQVNTGPNVQKLKDLIPGTTAVSNFMSSDKVTLQALSVLICHRILLLLS